MNAEFAVVYSSVTCPRLQHSSSKHKKADRQPESGDTEKEMSGNSSATETTETAPRVGPTLTQAEMEAVQNHVSPSHFTHHS